MPLRIVDEPAPGLWSVGVETDRGELVISRSTPEAVPIRYRPATAATADSIVVAIPSRVGGGNGTSRSTPSSANDDATSGVSLTRGVTVISSGPRASGRSTSAGGRPESGEARSRVVGRHREAVPTVSPRDRATVRTPRVAAEHDAGSVVAPGAGTRRLRRSRRSGRGIPDARRTRGAASRRGTRRSPRPGSRSRHRSHGTRARGSRHRRRV